MAPTPTHPALARLALALPLLLGSRLAVAVPVHGALSFGEAALTQSATVDEPAGYWQLDLGVSALPKVPPYRESLVVLEPLLSSNKSAPMQASIDMRGLHLEPRVVALGVGGTVTFKNGDRVPHTLRVDGPSALPPESTPAGQSRVATLKALGEFEIKAEAEPYLHGWVVTVATPYVATPDERGQWKLDLPEGHYRLRVFLRGAWLAEQTIEVTKSALELPVRVDELKAPGVAKIDDKEDRKR